MTSTPLSIVNRAIFQIGGGDVPQITSFSDGSAAAIAASALYTPAMQAALREIRPTFAQKYKVLVLSGNLPPISSFTYEYLLPSDSVGFLTVTPGGGSSLDPKPMRFREGTNLVSGAQTTVLWTNLAVAAGVYISGIVQGVLTTDTAFQGDSLFEESVVRFLKSSLAEALAGRFDQAKEALGQYFTIAQIADMRSDS